MKLGILVCNLGPSQQNYFLIKNANAVLADRADLDVIAFYENLARPCLPMNFAAMQVTEAWGYDAPIVATTLATADKLIRFPGPKKKFFYVWDLEWIRWQRKHYRTLHDIYGHPSLTLLARSIEHAQVIESCWNRPVAAVVDDFDMASLLEVTNV